MPVLLRFAAFAFVLALLPVVAYAQTYATHGDWSIVCDNQVTCTATGYAAEFDANAYVIVRQDAGRGAKPTILLDVQSDGPARDRKLEAIIEGPRGRTPIGPLNAVSDGALAQAVIPPPISAIVVNALRSAHAIRIRLVDRPHADEVGTVRLDGFAIAMHAMDVQQGRVTTIQPVPVVAAMRMRELRNPPKHPPVLVRNADAICGGVPDMWYTLAPGRTLRGVCTDGGAYNFAFRFFLISAGGTVPATFRVPWRDTTDTLVNPSVSKDGLILSSFNKGIGLGTCGEASDWVWDGRAFRLFRFAEMRECRGMESSDWPVLYRAFMR
jgi:hypothetical protein